MCLVVGTGWGLFDVFRLAFIFTRNYQLSTMNYEL